MKNLIPLLLPTTLAVALLAHANLSAKCMGDWISSNKALFDKYKVETHTNQLKSAAVYIWFLSKGPQLNMWIYTGEQNETIGVDYYDPVPPVGDPVAKAFEACHCTNHAEDREFSFSGGICEK